MMMPKYVPVKLPKNASSVASSSDSAVVEFEEEFEPESVSTKSKKEQMNNESPGEGKLMKVVCLQESNGSFKLDGDFAQLLDSSLKDIFEDE